METRETQIYDFERYQYGALAARLWASEESRKYTPGALEVLAGEKGLNLGEDALGFIRGTQASNEGIQTAAGVYAEKFQEKIGKYSPADLIGWYTPLLSGLEPKEKEKITGVLGEYKETLERITKKQNKADHIFNGKDIEGLYSKEQIDDAEKTREKYKKILSVLKMLNDYKFEGIRPDAVDEARKRDLKNLASKL